MLLHFITVPLVIARIGLKEFGNAGLVLAVWAPLLLVGTVIGQAVTRELGNRALMSDNAGARRIAESAAFLWLRASIGCLVLMIVAGPWVLRLLSGVTVSDRMWRSEIAIAGIAWTTQIASLMLQGASIAYQRFREVAWVALSSTGVSIASVVVGTKVIPDARGYLAGLAMGFVVGFMHWLLVTRIVDGEGFIVPRHHRGEMQSLVTFGKWQGSAQFAGTLSNQIDRYVLALMAFPAILGQYNAAKRIQEAGYSIALKVAEVLFPFFTATAHIDKEKQVRLYLLSSWVVMSCGSIVLGPMIPLAEPFMRTWIGSESGSGAGLLLRTFILGSLVGCGSNVFFYFLMGIGRNMAVALVSITYSALTIVFSVSALRLWGPYAAGAGLAVAGAMRLALSLYVLKSRVLVQMRVANWCASTLIPLCVPVALGYVWISVAAVRSVNGWAELMLAYGGISLSIAGAICVLASLSSFGRGALSDLLRAIRGLRAVRGA